MADDTAKISVTIDASGAKAGAADAVAAGEKIIATYDKVADAAAKNAEAVDKSEVKKAAARSKGAKAAKDAADGDAESTNRTLRSMKSMQTALDSYAKQWDPLVAAMEKTKRQYDVVFDISQKAKGDVQVRALNMLAEATDRMFVASRNLAAGFDVVARKTELAATFDKSGTSARQMAKELEDLHDALKLGVSIDGGYINKQQEIIEKYDEGAMAAKKLREAQAELVASAPAQSLAALNAVIAESVNSFDSAYTASVRYAAQLEKIQTAVSLGHLTPTEETAEKTKAMERYDATDPANVNALKAANNAAQAQKALAVETQRLQGIFPSAAGDAEKYASALQDLDAAVILLNLSQQEQAGHAAKLAGIYDPATKAANEAAKQTATAQDALNAQLERSRRLFPAVGAASQAYTDALHEIDAALSLEVIDDQRANAERARLAAGIQPVTRGLQNQTQSAFAARFATQQLGVQTVQFFSSLEAGQPFLMAFIGQAHQVLDVAIATGTGFKVLADGVKSFFSAIGGWIGRNPLTTALIAGTAAMAALGVMAETTARRLEGVKNVLSGVRPDFVAATQASEQLAKTLAATTALTTSQSREAATTLFQGGFTGTTEQGAAIIKIFTDLSKVVKETEPNFKRMAEAMKDPAAVMQTLLDTNHLAGLDQGMVNAAKRAQSLGKDAEAAAILMNALAVATKNVEDNLTPLEKAMLGLEKAFNSTWISGKSFASSMGEWVTGPIASMITGFTNLVNWVKELGSAFDNVKIPEWMKTVFGRVGTAINPIGALLSAIPTPGAGAAAASAAQQALLNAPGAVPTVVSPKGALGTMQLIPETAARMGVNPFIQSENILGGMKYLQGLVSQFQKSPFGALSPVEAATRAYNVGPAGKLLGEDAEKYAAQIAKADIGKLPTSTADMIEYWGNKLGMPADLIAVGKRIAMVEHGGFQGPTSKTESFLAPGGSSVTLGPGAPGGAGAPPILPTTNALQKAIKDAEEYDSSLKRVTDTTAKLTHTQDVLRQAIEEKSKLAAQGDTVAAEAVERYKFDLIAVQGELYRNLTPQQEYVKSLRETAAASEALTEGDRAILEVRRQLAEINKQHPETADVAQDAAALSAVLQTLSNDYKKLAFEAQIQIDAQNNITQAYKQGYAAVVQATAANEAYVASLKFPAGPMRDAARQGLTGLGVQRAVAGQEGLVEQQKLQNKDTIEYLTLEKDTLLMNNDARVAELAHLKATQEAKQKLSNLSPAVQAAYVAEADKVSKLNQELLNQKKALDTVAGMFEHAFDTISDAITQALVSGSGAAIKWQNVMMSVAQQILSQFLKLAVINPLLNQIFGGDRSTIGGVFDALNKVTPASSSTDSSAGSGGIFGTIFQLALKAGSLFSGGGAATPAIGTEVASTDFMGNPATYTYVGTGGGGATMSGFKFHSGGIVGANDNMPTTLLPAAMFANAPRFHSGSSGDLTNVLTRATDIMARRAGMQGLQPGEMPAVLMRNERVLTEQQDNALRMMVGGMADQLAAFKGTGTDGHRFTPNLPRFHGGSGGGEFSSIMSRGQQALSSAPVAAAPGGTDNVNINIDARGSTQESVNSFRRSMPQIASTMAEQLARARSRNG